MNLYIGRLNYQVTQKDIENFFAKYKPSAVEIIVDRENGSSKGFGFVTIPEESLANKAIAECNGKKIKGKNIIVNIARESTRPAKQTQNVSFHTLTTPLNNDEYISPYSFCKRASNKGTIEAYHAQLLKDRYDIAFDVKWVTLAATALNPCVITCDPKTKIAVPACCPSAKKESEYAGYNKRWLMMDGRLIISPFTVKSAIANGFANLLGGCYRFKVKQFILKPGDGVLQCHDDAVPQGSALCKDMTDFVCPRCKMFGMTDISEKKDIAAIGLKGRFKSAALVSTVSFKESEETVKKIPFFKRNPPDLTCDVRMKNWETDDGKVCQQLFLPIQGKPQGERTDKDTCYYDGNVLSGAKYYHHAHMTMAELIQFIKDTDSKVDLNDRRDDFAYKHRLRNYAQVCQEGIFFTGTLGAENCSVDEIAALLLLLDSRIASHGFKVGLGKAFGMGSISSIIEKVWLRKTDYKWYPLNKASSCEVLVSEINSHIPTLKMSIDDLQKTGEKIHAINSLLEIKERKLRYPDIGNRYYSDFRAHLYPKP